MKRQLDKTHVFISVMFIVMVTVISHFFSGVFAASVVTVDLQVDTTPVDPGETVSVEVTLDTFPNLTRFGPIEIQFDSSSVSFAGLERGTDIPSTFNIDHSASTSVIVITGIDNNVESQLLANQTAPTADSEGNPIPTPADPSMNRNEKTVLCRINFEVLESSKGEIRFWISNAAGFRNSALETVTVYSGSPVSIPVKTIVSTDASLASLSIDGAVLAPSFSPTTYEYKVSVPRSITELVVTAFPTSLSAQVFVSGQNGLALGENTLKISVLAQDLKTALEYTVLVTREVSYVPPGATVTDALGITYEFADFSEPLSLPSDFYQSEILLEGRMVPAFRMDGMKDVLLYLKSPSGEIGMFIYTPQANTVLAFDSKNVFFRLSQLLTVIPIPEGVLPPEGFRAETITFRGQSVQGYISLDGRTKVLYMQDDTGKARFYAIDLKDNDLYPFVARSQAETPAFLILFIVFLVLSVAEAFMLAIIIHQIRKRKPAAPTVRRV